MCISLVKVFAEEFDASKPELTSGKEDIVRHGLCNLDGVFGMLFGFIRVFLSDAYLGCAEKEFDSEISDSSGKVGGKGWVLGVKDVIETFGLFVGYSAGSGLES